MCDEAIGPATVAMILLGALFFLWPNLRPWVQEFRARARTGSAQRAVLKNLQALEKVRQQEDEVDGAEVAATLLQAASHPKSEEQKKNNVKRFEESNKRGSPSKPSFVTRFDLAAKAAIANTAQVRSMAVSPKRDSSDLFRSDIMNDSEASKSVRSASSPDHNATSTKKSAITESDYTGQGVDDCNDDDGGNDTYVFLSDVQPALEKVLVSIRNLDPLTKVISNVVSHPSDPKYRSLKLGHPTTKKVWFGSQRRLLEALGYTEENFSTMASSADANSSLETAAVVQLSYLSPSRLALHVHVARRLRDASERRRDELSENVQGHVDNSSNAMLSGEGSATNRATQAETPPPTTTITLVANDVLAKRLKAAAATGVLSLRNEPFFTAQAVPADPLIPNSSSRSSSCSSSCDLRSSARNEDSSESFAPLEALRMVANALTSPECSSRLRVLCLAGTGLGSNSILASRGAQLEEEQQQLHQGRQHLARIPFAKLSLGLDQPWASLQSLRNLDLDNNELTALPPALSLLVNLKRLSVSHNRLGDSDYDGTSDVASGGGSEEIHASLDFSGATCIPVLPPGLQRLALAGNGLQRVPLAVAAHANLREVNMDLNHLKSFPEELFWCPRLERVSLAGNLISALPLKPTARPTYSDGLGSDLSETPPNSTPAAAGGALEAASTSDTSATTITSSKSRETVAPLAALKHLDLSFNCFAVEGLHQAWVFTDTLLEGLALDGNVPGLSSDAFLALPGVSSFMERRIKTKNKGQGGCWFAPGGVSSFGFCGLDHGNANAVARLSK